MRVLVLLGVGADVRIAPARDPRSGRVRDEWLVHEVDPASASALDLALRLKADRPGTEVTVLHLGPPAAEPWLRRALAQGADRAVRVWDEETTAARAAAKAVILAAAVQTLGFDLVFAGAAGVIDAGGQLGVLVAAELAVPCVTQVVELRAAAEAAASTVGATASVAAAPVAGTASLEMIRRLERGFRERARTALPCVVTVSAEEPGGADTVSHAVSATALLEAQDMEICVWDLSDLGVPRERVACNERTLRYGMPRSRRPRLQPLLAPDPALPAFDRILRLIQGSGERREGRVVRESPEAIVAEIFGTLRDEGWLDHLRPGNSP